MTLARYFTRSGYFIYKSGANAYLIGLLGCHKQCNAYKDPIVTPGPSKCSINGSNVDDEVIYYKPEIIMVERVCQRQGESDPLEGLTGAPIQASTIGKLFLCWPGSHITNLSHCTILFHPFL